MTFETAHSHSLTFMQTLTIVDALTAYALFLPDSTDERIRNVIGALQAIGYTETASTLERLQNDSSSAMRARIESYSTKAHG